MKKVFAVALGILTAIGGFVDIGDLVTNAMVAARHVAAVDWECRTVRVRAGLDPLTHSVGGGS